MNCKPKANHPNRGFMQRAFVATLAVLMAAPVMAAERQTLKGHVISSSAAAPRIATLPPPERMSLTIGLPLRNREVLTNLLDQLYDPAGTNFHRYLTAAQFAEQFGPTESDYNAVVEFARTNGFTIKGTHPNRTLVQVEGSRKDVERVFHVNIGVYQHPTEARTFFAPDVEPSVDLAVPILHIDGLDNFFVSKPNLKRMPRKPSGFAGSGPQGTLWGYDYRACYAPGVTLTGAGQRVALYEREGYASSDITAYESNCGLPNVPVQNIPIDGFSFVPDYKNDVTGVQEVCVDIEVAIAMAPGLSSVMVYGATNDNLYASQNDILNRIATDNQAAQISSSWGFSINATTDQIFQQYAIQGQSLFKASGDSGAYVGTITFGEDDPYITVVGGTELNTDVNTNWETEEVWNFGGASSGGISTTYFIPSYQWKVNMSANQGSTTYRNLPDVAMVADQVYAWAEGEEQFLTGTSIASPLWAGFMALVNQQAGAIGRPRVGFLNPALYQLGEGNFPSSAYHDIVSGNNTTSSSPSKFYAAPGYDLCTGWGSPNGANMINALALFGSATWVDFNFTGSPERGDFDSPYKTLGGGVTAVPNNGVIAIKPGTSSETPTLTKPMTIMSAGGSATIGQ